MSKKKSGFSKSDLIFKGPPKVLAASSCVYLRIERNKKDLIVREKYGNKNQSNDKGGNNGRKVLFAFHDDDYDYDDDDDIQLTTNKKRI
ncbi:hypothetical protein M0802_015327 [Mischocyttarus mexicanus]|nr:hypothetical protein M0802_015327 [Mischocyttarus mexicanus]